MTIQYKPKPQRIEIESICRGHRLIAHLATQPLNRKYRVLLLATYRTLPYLYCNTVAKVELHDHTIGWDRIHSYAQSIVFLSG
jgi:hypothetical protein